MEGQENSVSGEAVESQAVEEVSQASENVETESQSSDSGEEKLPFGKHPRWQKMVSENRTYKQQLQDLQKVKAEYESSKDAIEFKRLLDAHPDKHEQILALLQGKKAAEQEQSEEAIEEDWSEYDPKIAEQMKKFSKAIKRLERLEGVAKQFEEMSAKEQSEYIEQNKVSLEEKFKELLQKDGFIDQAGKYDEKKIRLLSNDVLVELMKIAKDPDIPTEKELMAAYKIASESVQAFKTEGLKQVSIPKVPPTGSGSGVSVNAQGKKKPMSIEEMTRALETGVIPD